MSDDDNCNEPCPPLIFKGDGQPARCGRERGHAGLHLFRMAKNGKAWCECAWGDIEAEGIDWPKETPQSLLSPLPTSIRRS